MGRVELPVILGSLTSDEAIKLMRERDVSACVVEYEKAHHLLTLRRITEAQREWRQAPKVAALIHGRVLLQIGEKDLDSWFNDPYAVAKKSLRRVTPIAAQYVLVNVARGTAVVFSRFEWLAGGGGLSSKPIQYKCVDDASHVWDADDLGGVLECPSIMHAPPRPKVKQI
jgi:hypothetical protein